MKNSRFFKLISPHMLCMIVTEKERRQDMKDFFTIADMTVMTGLSSRTIRTYIAEGFLQGDKSSGVWQFSPEQIDRFFNNAAVRPTLRAKKNAVVYDFLGAPHGENMMCVVLDLPAESLSQASALFCGYISEIQAKAELRFASDRIGKKGRVILSGSDADVMELLARYYNER